MAKKPHPPVGGKMLHPEFKYSVWGSDMGYGGEEFGP